MSCRCRDIRKCNNDISLIQEIVSSLNEIKDIEENIDDKYVELAVLSKRTFLSDNMVILNKKQNELNEPIKETLPDLLKKCDEKISSLQRKLCSMRSEDRHYHKKREINRKEGILYGI